MDIATAERALTHFVAQQGGLGPGQTALGSGKLPEAAPLATVRFVSGRFAGEALADCVAEVRGVFAEPEEARAFAAALWGELPRYGAEGFAELAAEGGVEFAEHKGFFTATGRVRARFA